MLEVNCKKFQFENTATARLTMYEVVTSLLYHRWRTSFQVFIFSPHQVLAGIDWPGKYVVIVIALVSVAHPPCPSPL